MPESVGASTTLQMLPLDSKEITSESLDSLQDSTTNLNSFTSSEQFSNSLCQSDADISLNERLNALLMDTKPLKSSVQTVIQTLLLILGTAMACFETNFSNSATNRFECRME